METNQKATVTNAPAGKPQSESNAIGSKIKDNEKLSREDIKFIGELGWLGAAAVTIAAIAASV
jgi:hypothetical protein